MTKFRSLSFVLLKMNLLLEIKILNIFNTRHIKTEEKTFFDMDELLLVILSNP